MIWDSLSPYKQVWAIDFEFNALAGERPSPVCCVARELRSGQLLRLGSDELKTMERGLVIYFPGNSLNRSERIQDLREVADFGYDVLVFDYRGYGDSTGNPSESALTKDAKQIWKFARDELQYPENQITLFGESLGGAVALSLWSDSSESNLQPRTVILSSTFASMSRTVHEHYPWFPFHYLVLDRWPSVDCIKNVKVPITIFHGTEDDFVSLAQARTLAKAPHTPPSSKSPVPDTTTFR